MRQLRHEVVYEVNEIILGRDILRRKSKTFVGIVLRAVVSNSQAFKYQPWKDILAHTPINPLLPFTAPQLSCTLGLSRTKDPSVTGKNAHWPYFALSVTV